MSFRRWVRRVDWVNAAMMLLVSAFALGCWWFVIAAVVKRLLPY